MLNIIVSLLKIIGILILVILGLILLILTLVLCVPIRYQIRASYHEALKATARASWFLHLISIFVTYEETLDYTVKLLGFTVLSGGKEEGSTEPEILTTTKEVSLPAKQSADTGKTSAQKENMVSPEESVTSKKENTISKETVTSGQHRTTKNQAAKQQTPKQSIKEKLSSKIESISGKLSSMKNKADRILHFIKNPANQETFKLILRQIKAILKHLLPRKLKAEAVLGFDDPATTGQVLSLCSILYLWYGENVQITPIFDESILEGDAKMRGRIRLGTLLILVLRILFDKNFRILYKRWRANGGILDG